MNLSTTRICGLGIICLLLVSGSVSDAHAQRNKLKLPKSEPISLQTKDNVMLRCTYYPGGVIEKDAKEEEYVEKPGKEVVPVILLHGWDGNRNEFDFLASVLQRQGHCVVVPDMRGHGESLSRRLANGGEQKIDRDRMRSADMLGMVLDVEAIKKFLLEKNNEGELNIELLCVVGAELGAITAINWAAHDWSWPQLPTFKQGRDIKAIVLLSPLQTFKGVTANTALKHPAVNTGLSVMIVAGQTDRKGYSDAKSIYKRIERNHKETEDPKEKDLYMVEPDTSLKGTKLVDPRARLPVFQLIAKFIELRLVDRSATFAWTDRKNPLDDSE